MNFISGSGEDTFYVLYNQLKVFVKIGNFPNANKANQKINKLGLFDANKIVRINSDDNYDVKQLLEIKKEMNEISLQQLQLELEDNSYKEKIELYKKIYKNFDKDVHYLSSFDIMGHELPQNIMDRTFIAVFKDENIAINLGHFHKEKLNDIILNNDLLNLEYGKTNIKYSLSSIEWFEKKKDAKNFLSQFDVKELKDIKTDSNIPILSLNSAKENFEKILKDIYKNGNLTQKEISELKSFINTKFEKILKTEKSLTR
jgi:hypothetical protein